MNYELKSTKIFLEQVRNLSYSSKQIVKNKILLVKENPSRYKSLVAYGLNLFRIRFSDNRVEKRIIYSFDGKIIKFICILDRKNNYNDLKKILKSLEDFDHHDNIYE